jgi:peroxiredoxin Q/BCP
MSLLNQPAPDFTLRDQEDREHALSDYRGKMVLLYFYPKDMTPGCTIEAKGFQVMLNQFAAAGVQVLGVSADTCQSHKKFAAAHQLHFPLLADTERAVVQAYGVLQEKSMFGKKYIGILRQSFLIDPQGVVVKHYEKVDTRKHPQEVLHDVMQRASSKA